MASKIPIAPHREGKFEGQRVLVRYPDQALQPNASTADWALEFTFVTVNSTHRR